MTGRLVPDYKTIADFRKDNGPAFRKVCAQFVALCRRLELFADASVAIDGSKFKAVTLTFGEESVRGQATASDQDRIRCQPPIVLPWSVTGGRQLANLGSNRSNETDTGRISLFIFCLHPPILAVWEKDPILPRLNACAPRGCGRRASAWR